MLRTLEERDIRFVRLWFTDVLGSLKSVAVAPAELEGAFADGIGSDFQSRLSFHHPVILGFRQDEWVFGRTIAQAIDPDRIAFLCFARGGYTCLVLFGANPDWAMASALC